MNKNYLFIIVLPLFLSCIPFSEVWKELDLGVFKISLPQKWEYKKQQGEDSFIGYIEGTGVSLSFDFSKRGYANSLIPTIDDYLKHDEWLRGCYFCKPGIVYTSNFNIENTKLEEMKKRGTTDSTLVKVEADPSYETTKRIHLPTKLQKTKFPKADYIADLTYRDSTIYVPIEIPFAVKSHNIKIDTTDRYIIKTIFPKVGGKGMTGIYIRSRSSNLNFQMNGVNLSAKDQKLALEAFKTITFK